MPVMDHTDRQSGKPPRRPGVDTVVLWLFVIVEAIGIGFILSTF